MNNKTLLQWRKQLLWLLVKVRKLFIVIVPCKVKKPSDNYHASIKKTFAVTTVEGEETVLLLYHVIVKKPIALFSLWDWRKIYYDEDNCCVTTMWGVKKPWYITICESVVTNCCNYHLSVKTVAIMRGLGNICVKEKLLLCEG